MSAVRSHRRFSATRFFSELSLPFAGNIPYRGGGEIPQQFPPALKVFRQNGHGAQSLGIVFEFHRPPPNTGLDGHIGQGSDTPHLGKGPVPVLLLFPVEMNLPQKGSEFARNDRPIDSAFFYGVRGNDMPHIQSDRRPSEGSPAQHVVRIARRSRPEIFQTDGNTSILSVFRKTFQIHFQRGKVKPDTPCKTGVNGKHRTACGSHRIKRPKMSGKGSFGLFRSGITELQAKIAGVIADRDFAAVKLTGVKRQPIKPLGIRSIFKSETTIKSPLIAAARI